MYGDKIETPVIREYGSVQVKACSTSVRGGDRGKQNFLILKASKDDDNPVVLYESELCSLMNFIRENFPSFKED